MLSEIYFVLKFFVVD